MSIQKKKITAVDSSKKSFQGNEVLVLPAGTVLRVIYHPQYDALNDHVVLTTSKEHPLLSLDTGSLWGNSLDNYRFQVALDVKIKIKY
jgi:hypothetical protein